MSFSAITQKAMQLIAAEEAEKRAAALKLEAAATAAAEEKERTELQARLALQAERELARIQAERLLAEQQAVAAREAESAALKAEIDRLRNRSETEILRDELANLRAEIAAMRQQTQALPTKQILQESTVVQQQIADLKATVESLEQYLSLRHFYSQRNHCGNWAPKTFVIPAKNELFGDPAIGHRKTLTVKYEAAPPDTPGCGNITSFSVSAKENENLKVIVANMCRFRIFSATWGAGAQMKDVTEIVKSMCQ